MLLENTPLGNHLVLEPGYRRFVNRRAKPMGQLGEDAEARQHKGGVPITLSGRGLKKAMNSTTDTFWSPSASAVCMYSIGISVALTAACSSSKANVPVGRCAGTREDKTRGYV